MWVVRRCFRQTTFIYLSTPKIIGMWNGACSMAEGRILTLLISTVAVLLLVVPVASAGWDYTTTINDSTGDNGGYPSFTDIVVAVYGYNATHFSFNTTLNGDLSSLGDQSSSPNNETIWFGIILDVDKNSSTGYMYQGLGGDYYIEVRVWKSGTINFESYLYQYSGDGSSWGWTRLGPVDFTEVVAGSTSNINITQEKASINWVGGDFYVAIWVTYAKGTGSSTTVDYLVYGPTNALPIPESYLFVAIPLVGAAVAALVYAVKRIG